MKLAYFSPLPPKRTGIATYSKYLGVALSELAEVHLYDSGLSFSPSSKIPVLDFVAQPGVLSRLNGYDACIYHIGNNPCFHLDIYKVLLRKPGIVVLHDTVLYFLIAGLGKGGMVKEFCLNYGFDRLKELWSLIEDCPCKDVLRYRFPERYPFLKRIFSKATAIVVHNNTSKHLIKEAGYQGAVHVIGLLSYPQIDGSLLDSNLLRLRAKHNLSEDIIVIGSFGFIGPTKRIPSLLGALERLKDIINFKLFIIGEGEDIQKEIAKRNLRDRVIQLGFVSDEDFNHYLALTDIVVNLRYPSMGESSATLIQAFSYGKPCIVTDHAWFSEIPDQCVIKIGYGRDEIDQLEKEILELAEKPILRRQIGRKAHEYVESHCMPDKIAKQYIEILRGTPMEYSKDKQTSSNSDRDWVINYLVDRTLGAIPDRATTKKLKSSLTSLDNFWLNKIWHLFKT